MATYLSAIVDAHRAAAAADRRDLGALGDLARVAPAPLPFAARLRGGDGRGSGVIAEIKRRSPSRGDLAPDLVAADLAQAYRRGGARCLSVLTDRDHFGGSPEDLRQAKAAGGLPVLRKDFTVAAADVLDARIMGADAVLLIVAALAHDELVELHRLAVDLGLDALVEVHDETELERALGIGAVLVGVNQRDLVSFDVDHARAARLAPRIPEHVVAIAESGVRDASDARSLARAGYDAVLVGETLVRSADPSRSVAALGDHPVGRRTPAGVGAG
jgi:indole-3-glycerol phosphate synthase